MSEKIEQEPAIGISYKIPMPVNKELVFQLFVSRDTSVEELNVLLDKVRMAGAHQCRFARQESEMAKAFARIEDEEKNVDFLEDQIGQLKASVAAEMGRFEGEKEASNGKARMKDSSRAVIEQARDKVERYKEDIVVRKQRVADTRKALEGWI